MSVQTASEQSTDDKKRRIEEMERELQEKKAHQKAREEALEAKAAELLAKQQLLSKLQEKPRPPQ